MPESMGVTVESRVGTETFSQTADVTADSSIRTAPTVAAAKAGTLTTRTDNNTGTFTMASGHGFLTNDKIDVFWSGGQRRGMTATVTGDSVVLDGGTGDNLPVATTAITAMKPHEENFALDGDDLAGLTVFSPVPAFVVFVDGSDAVIGDPITLTGTGGSGYVWSPGLGADNPLAGGTVAKVLLSHGSAAAQTLRVIALFN